MKFSDLGLSDDIQRAIADAGYDTSTPNQAQAIPYVLMNRDLLGCAQTGTGKTASFTLPMIEILAHGRTRARMPRSLILEPTRELAAQVSEQFETYGKYHKLTKALLIGGVSFTEQNKALDRGVDVLIATPGRLMDHAERGKVLLRDVKILVIDEADRMLDMGFMPDIQKIVSLLPNIRQTLFFSATMPPEIRRLSGKFLSNPKEVSVSPPATAAETISQALIKVAAKDKRKALRDLMRAEDVQNALIFCNRKRDIGVLHRSLERDGFKAGALHGDMDQYSRTDTLEKFKAGEFNLLVCSDVAARGLDVASMSHVFNYDVPTHADDYIHRIGRTGRAGKQGRAITIATPEDKRYLESIAKLIGYPIPPIEGFESSAPATGGEEAEEKQAPTKHQPSARRSHNNDRGSKPRAENKPRAEKLSSTTESAPERRPRPDRPAPATNRDDNNSASVPFGQDEHVPAFLLRKP